jgi:hypothetical protein
MLKPHPININIPLQTIIIQKKQIVLDSLQHLAYEEKQLYRWDLVLNFA